MFHYLETGWMGYHENSPWAPAFEKVDFQGAIKNILILGWRLLDFGRVKKVKNLFIADGSTLINAPGVNPQATIMAVSRRNAESY